MKKTIAVAIGSLFLFQPNASPAALIDVTLFDFHLDFTGTFDHLFPSNTGDPQQDNSVRLVYREDDHSARLTVTGGDFDSSRRFTGTISGDFWNVTFTVSEQAGFINDAITVGGNFIHRLEPDPGVAGGEGALYTWGNKGQGGGYTLDADEMTEVNDVLFARVSDGTIPLMHPDGPHWDNYTSFLSAGGSNTAFVDDITTYTFNIVGRHSANAATPVPEPSTLSMVLFGALGFVATRLRRAFRSQKTTRSLDPPLICSISRPLHVPWQSLV